MEMTVDSGASETVINEDMILSAELREGAASRRGVEYQVANGEKIPIWGKRTSVRGQMKVSIGTSKLRLVQSAKHC